MKRIEGVSGCAACFNASEGVFVDLGAAFDGPHLENGMTVDDLILCEACVRQAHAKLDESPAEVMSAMVERDALRVELEKAQQYAKALEGSLALRPVAELPKVKKTAKKAAA